MATDTLSVTLDARIEAGNWQAQDALESLAETTFAALLSHPIFQENVSVMDGSEVSLLFTDDAHIQTINADHRGQDKPTNVLSFPQLPPDAKMFGPYLGDLVFAQETLAREATLENKSLTHHLQHLMVHGFLHLVGYDHSDDNEANTMESLEIAVLADLGISNPYEG